MYLRIVLVLIAVVLVVELVGLPLGLFPNTVLTDPVLSLGLSQLVDLGGGEAGKELLCELMGDRLA
jgi:hypothetical protein